MPDIRPIPPVGNSDTQPTVTTPAPGAADGRRRDVTTPDLPPAVHRPHPTPGGSARATGPRNLFEAVNDASFTPRDPSELNVPAELLDAIGAAQTVLLVGHTNPDVDTSGSTLALARLLESLGKQVDLCIDDDLPGGSRILDDEHRIKRAAALEGKRWDLALVVDVSQRVRIGDAVGLLKDAATVAVVDHHVADPQRTEFALPDSTRFLRWLEPDYPAAGLQVMAIMSRYLPQARERGANLTALAVPALAAFASDTGFGRYASVDKETFRYFKHVLTKTAGVSYATVEKAMKFELPDEVAGLIAGRLRPNETHLPRRVKEKLVALEQEGKGIQKEIFMNAGGREPALGILMVTDAYFDTLAEVGKSGLDSPPIFTRDDLVNAIKWGPAGAMRKEAPLAALLLETGAPGQVAASLRGKDAWARLLAESLGGGGHDAAAGAVIMGTSLAEVRQRILTWVRENAPGGLTG